MSDASVFVTHRLIALDRHGISLFLLVIFVNFLQIILLLILSVFASMAVSGSAVFTSHFLSKSIIPNRPQKCNKHFVFVFINYYRNFDIIYLVPFELSFIFRFKCSAATTSSSETISLCFSSLSSSSSLLLAFFSLCHLRRHSFTIKRFVWLLLSDRIQERVILSYSLLFSVCCLLSTIFMCLYFVLADTKKQQQQKWTKQYT